MDYHVARNSQKLGVFPEAEIRAGLQVGTFQPADLVWCEGMPGWRAAGEVFGPVGAPPPAMPPPSAGTVPVSGGAALPPKPTNYLIPAILVTLLCCLPFGIAAIVFAAQVDSKYAGGDYAGAQRASDKAKLWMWLGLGIGLAGALAYIGFMVFGMMAAGGFVH